MLRTSPVPKALYVMRLYKIPLVFSLFVFFAGCSQKDARLSFEHQAYEFLFNEILQDSTHQILLSDRYSSGKAAGESAGELIETYKELTEFPQVLLKRFSEVSESTEKVDWNPIMVSAKYADMSDRPPSWSMAWWQDFEERNEGFYSYYSVSEVVVDSATLEAVFLFSYHCPALCGAHDTFVYLKKYGMEWRVVSARRLWVS